MDNTINCIKQFIKKYQEESLFLFDSDIYKKKEYLPMLLNNLDFEDEKHRLIVDNTKWLFFSNYGPLGYYTDNNKKSSVIFINESGNVEIFCKYPQDIPLEMLRRKSEDWLKEENNIQEYIYKNDLYKIPTFIKVYNEWLKEKGIMIDPDNIYYDRYGKIFNYYFEIEYIINNLEI